MENSSNTAQTENKLPWVKPEVKKLIVNLDTAGSPQNTSTADFGGEG